MPAQGSSPYLGLLLALAIGLLIGTERGWRQREASGGPADEAAVAIASAMMIGGSIILVGVLATFVFPAVAALLA